MLTTHSFSPKEYTDNYLSGEYSAVYDTTVHCWNLSIGDRHSFYKYRWVPVYFSAINHRYNLSSLKHSTWVRPFSTWILRKKYLRLAHCARGGIVLVSETLYTYRLSRPDHGLSYNQIYRQFLGVFGKLTAIQGTLASELRCAASELTIHVSDWAMQHLL